jgi:hypothetical protein
MFPFLQKPDSYYMQKPDKAKAKIGLISANIFRRLRSVLFEGLTISSGGMGWPRRLAFAALPICLQP